MWSHLTYPDNSITRDVTSKQENFLFVNFGIMQYAWLVSLHLEVIMSPKKARLEAGSEEAKLHCSLHSQITYRESEMTHVNCFYYHHK